MMADSTRPTIDEIIGVTDFSQFVDALNYVSPLSNLFDWHYRSNFPSDKEPEVPYQTNASYFWTSGLTYCVAIAYHYQPADGGQPKFGLFHSVSEHANVDDKSCQNFKKAFAAFIHDIPSTKNLAINIFYNGKDHSDFGAENDSHHIFDLLNKICTLENKPALPIENIRYLRAPSETFYITKDGEIGTLPNAAQDTLADIKQLILETVPDKYHQDKNKPYKAILDLCALSEKQNPISTLNKTKTEAGDYLLAYKKKHALKKLFADDVKETDKITCLKIIAWDAILQKPSADLLNQWMEKNRYKLSQDTFAAVIATESTPHRTLKKKK